MAWGEREVQNWADFVDLAGSFGIGGPVTGKYVFRGQADAGWFLEPTLRRLARDLKLSAEQALNVEKNLLREFKAQAHLHLGPNDVRENMPDLWWHSLMRHHYAPSRLLDWSRSIFVAAYHAVTQEWKKPGAVWLFHRPSFTSAMQQAFKGYNTSPSFSLEMGRYSRQDPEFYQPDAPNELHVFARYPWTDRMVAQQSVFTVCKQILADHGDVIENAITLIEGETLLLKILIKPELKLNFLQHLRAANITANALFPGVDGLGRSLEELARLQGHYLKDAAKP
jgi:hypothetical protein